MFVHALIGHAWPREAATGLPKSARNSRPHKALRLPAALPFIARSRFAAFMSPCETFRMLSIPTPEVRVPSAALEMHTALTAGQEDFMARLALQLGLPATDCSELVAPRLFTGPAGLACRLHLQPGEPPAVKPEALLPIAAQELAGADVQRLLAAQSLVLAELGWFLGTSPEGLLQLSSLAWIDDPVDAATGLDLANGVGLPYSWTMVSSRQTAARSRAANRLTRPEGGRAYDAMARAARRQPGVMGGEFRKALYELGPDYQYGQNKIFAPTPVSSKDFSDRVLQKMAEPVDSAVVTAVMLQSAFNKQATRQDAMERFKGMAATSMVMALALSADKISKAFTPRGLIDANASAPYYASLVMTMMAMTMPGPIARGAELALNWGGGQLAAAGSKIAGMFKGPDGQQLTTAVPTTPEGLQQRVAELSAYTQSLTPEQHLQYERTVADSIQQALEGAAARAAGHSQRSNSGVVIQEIVES